MTNSKNFIGLLLIQGSNALLPIIIFPYIFITVGSDIYRHIVFTEAINLFIITTILYGFDITATNKVILLRSGNNKKLLSSLFSNVIYIRIFIFILLEIIIILIFYLLKTDLFPYMIGWSLFSLSYALQSNWFFHGLENNYFFGIITLLFRVITVISIFSLPADYLSGPLTVLFIGFFAVLSSCISIFFAFKRYSLKIEKIQMSIVKELIWSSKEVFVSSFSVGLFRNTNIIIMDLLSVSSNLISIYSLAEKVTKSIQSITRPLSQYFYPKILRISKNHKEPSLRVMKEIFPSSFYQLVSLFIIWGAFYLLFILSEKSFSFFTTTPEDREKLMFSFFIMSISTMLGILNYIYGTVALNALNKEKYLMRVIIITGLTTVIYSFFSISYMSFYGAPISYLFGEAFLLIMILLKYLNHKKTTY